MRIIMATGKMFAMRLLRWLGGRDPGLAALRRAGRTAIIMPALFALGAVGLDDPTLATFAAFGSFAMLLLVDFSGPIRERLLAQAALAGVGAVFVGLGTLAARSAVLAAASMALVGFVVLFAGVVSSVLAGATPSLLLAFILPVTVPGSLASIPDRLAGWAIASVVAWLAVAVLWPAPARDPLRGPATAAARALARRLRTDVAYVLTGDGTGSVIEDGRCEADHDRAAAEASAAVAELRRRFLATPYRPTGLGTANRTVVRLVDELTWLDAIVVQTVPRPSPTKVNRTACAVKVAAAAVLERGADLLDVTGGDPADLRAAQTQLHHAVAAMELAATEDLPLGATTVDLPGGTDRRIDEFVTSLDPTFRAQELSFVVSQIAANIDLTAAAERRTWWQRLLGHQPPGLAGPLSAAQERAAAHVERHSVWLHNSVRGAIGLGLAVLVADLSGVQHSFWVVLGTLSVLRSNALNTGQNALRGLLGTVVGFVVGAALLVPIGTHTAILWFLLPPAILFAGVAPAAISFAAGQAAFTLTLVILFNIIQPAGWRVGLLRVEDIALGCAVSLIVGLLFWPRGAGAALGRALAEAYTDSARYLGEAVDFGMLRCAARPPGTPAPPAPTTEAVRAAAAARRLDDTFRSYLAERGAKPVPLAEVTSLVTGVAGLRLAADAVLDLWQRDDGRAPGDRAAARRQLMASTDDVIGWYAGLAASLTGAGPAPDPQPPDGRADGRLVDAVRQDLRGADGRASATAVRVIWTGDHLDAARRLQATLVGSGRAVGTASVVGTARAVGDDSG